MSYSWTQVSWENQSHYLVGADFFFVSCFVVIFSVFEWCWAASCEASGKQSQNVTRNTSNKVKLNKNTLSELKAHDCQSKRAPARTWKYQPFVTHLLPNHSYVTLCSEPPKCLWFSWARVFVQWSHESMFVLTHYVSCKTNNTTKNLRIYQVWELTNFMSSCQT